MKNIIFKWIAVLLIGSSILFAYLAYNISQKKLYRVTWGGVTNEFLIQAKTNPKEFKITKEPSIIIVDSCPEVSENYYSASELDSFTNKGEFVSVHLFTFKQYQQLPFFSMGSETKKKRTNQQTYFYSYLFLCLLSIGGAPILYLKSKKITLDKKV